MNQSAFARLTLILLAVLVVAGIVFAQSDDIEITYEVQLERPLEDIAEAFNLQAECVAERNGMTPDTVVSPGDTLILPITCPQFGVPVQDVVDESVDDDAPVVETPDAEDAETEMEVDVDVDIDTEADDDVEPDVTEPDMAEPDVTIVEGAGGGTDEIFYEVQPRDNIDTIAQSFDVQIECLLERNDLTRASVIYADDPLFIPTSCPPYGSIPVIVLPMSLLGQGGGLAAGEEVYVVQPGDIIFELAREFDVSFEALLAANDFDRAVIVYPGQQIIVPAFPPFGIVPVTRTYRGATAGGLGQGGGGTLDSLQPGEVGYIAQPGDFLDLIAFTYNVRVTCLAERNNLLEDYTIYPGDLIIVPTDCREYNGTSTASALTLRGPVVTADETGIQVNIFETLVDLDPGQVDMEMDGDEPVVEIDPPTPTPETVVVTPTAEIIQATPTATPTVTLTPTTRPTQQQPFATPTPETLDQGGGDTNVIPLDVTPTAEGEASGEAAGNILDIIDALAGEGDE